MYEYTVAGANAIAFPNLSTWGWEIAMYLFLGGMVAGLMILGGMFRLSGSLQFEASAVLSDLVGLPLLGVGMLLLFMDLSSKVNVWRLYTTFQVASPMSWGSWILLLAMALLALRLISRLPAPRPIMLFGTPLFRPIAPPPIAGGESQDVTKTSPHTDQAARRQLVLPTDGMRKETLPKPGVIEKSWRLLRSIALYAKRWERPQAALCIILGIGVGFYTGVLLSSIEARPLWSSVALAPLFLVSGLASAVAFLCLFMRKEEHTQLVPLSITICGLELLLILAFALTITSGSEVARHAAPILFGGAFGALFWGIVVFVGVIAPAMLETLGLLRHSTTPLSARLSPLMKLAGGLTLRFVVVYAGLRCFL